MEYYYGSIKSKIYIFHFLGLSSLFIIKNVQINTLLLHAFLFYLGEISITGGYHRLWSHKSYEASLPLQIFYLIFGTTANQSSVLWWAKAHRTHHRNEEQPGDPYNITKGLYHAHVGWLIEGNDNKELHEIKMTNVDDLYQNKLLVFQHQYYSYLWMITLCGITGIPMLWNETIMNSFFINFIRIVLILNATWCVNSLAHYIGNQPYNNSLKASDNFFVSLITMGEGWHNYHHSFPKDYRASELGKYNPTTFFIDFTKTLGLSSNHHYKNSHIEYKERFNKEKYNSM